ncbi:hypothetical protein TNCV_2742901 [Trichonephila clavipes]|nr:hypothetical protein TNCV_2742901 [Trichonephila clavipes]
MIGDEKWVAYVNIVRKRSWSKRGEAALTVTKPGLMTRKVLLCICFTSWFGWKRVAINSGPKELKGHVNEKVR